jgi:hypothetical protein
MKREILRLALVGSVLSALLIGCSTAQYEPTVTTTPRGEVVVSQAPPPPRTEMPGIAPSAEQVWINGYWSYREGHYIWIPGHWEVRPRPTATYIPGHWAQSSRGWVWTPGYWQ